MSFLEFIALLEKHYDVKIIVPSRELNISKLTGALDANQNISQILDMMKKNINYEWRKEDNAYVITY
ncbi:protein of unknown function [Porphyromonadaceae bacterium NLAE-zl-C104]|nr:protein of unknown function [Porphyromonadaceae bacterium NLAE-zl-C104]